MTSVALRRPQTSGAAALAIGCGPGRSRIVRLYAKDPLRLLFPTPGVDEPLQAVVANVSGGLLGGDRLRLDFDLSSGSTLQVTSQAAEKVYRAPERPASVESRITLGAGACLDWMPQETILFDAAGLDRRLVLEMARGARALVGELTVFGRLARGERVRNGRFTDRIEMRRDGKLLWADSLRLEGSGLVQALSHPACFSGNECLVTMLYIADDADSALDRVREAISDGPGEIGASALGPLVLVRALAHDWAELRQAYAGWRSRLRADLLGLPARLPSFWHA
jgi:urease accessory protein